MVCLHLQRVLLSGSNKTVIGIRASKDDEEYGLDLSELGSMGYPEFTKK